MALRRMRVERRQSLRGFAAAAGIDFGYIGQIERGERRCSEDFALICDQTLGANGQLMEAYRAESGDTERRDGGRGAWNNTEDLMQRRILIQHALTTLAAGATLPALDVIRSGLVSSITGQDALDADVAEWEQVAHEYGIAFFNQTPEALVINLGFDIADLQGALDVAPERARHDLSRVSAFLAAIMAMSLTNLGQFQPARRWWYVARKAADRSGEPGVRSWVRGHDATHALYDHRPLQTALNGADEGIAAGAGGAFAGTAEALGARAQALALLGKADEAAATSRQLAEMVERLPDRPSTVPTIFEYPQHRMWHSTSYVHTHLAAATERSDRVRALAAAQQAQHNALSMYPSDWHRPRAQVELHAARCLVHDGDFDDGAERARQVIESVPLQHRTAMVLGMAEKVIDAVPATEQRRASVAGLREMLALPARTATA